MGQVGGGAGAEQHHRQADVVHQLRCTFDEFIVDHAALFQPDTEKEHHKNRGSDVEGKEKCIECVLKQVQFSKREGKIKSPAYRAILDRLGDYSGTTNGK